MAAIRDFLCVVGLVGLPIFTLAVLVIWKPVPPGGEVRPSLAVRVLSTATAVLLCWMTVVGLLFIPYIIWRIWREPRKESGPLADRVGWTVTAFGVALASATAAYFVVQESKHFRSRETIERQSWIFLAVATTPLAGPLTAFALHRRGAKRPTDPLEAPIDPGVFD